MNVDIWIWDFLLMSEIIFIGTASGAPVPDRSHASCLMKTGSGSYLFDAGDGCCSSLRRNRIDLDRIVAVFISHMHADHCAGLPMLLQMMYLDGRAAPLHIHLPGEGLQGLRAWLASTYLFPAKFPFRLTLSPVADGIFFQDETVTVTSYLNRHLHGYQELKASSYPQVNLESYSFAITTEDRRVVYSGDIASVNDLQAAIEGTDLLVIEATHVACEEAVLFAAANNLDRVVFTHLPPGSENMGQVADELRRKHGLKTLALAFDGMKISV